MLAFGNTALDYTRGFDQPGFRAERMRYDATLRNIELIGEASTHVPPEVRALAPGLPWRQIIGTRNRLAHAYLGIDADTVWDIVSNELPQLRGALTALLAMICVLRRLSRAANIALIKGNARLAVAVAVAVAFATGPTRAGLQQAQMPRLGAGHAGQRDGLVKAGQAAAPMHRQGQQVEIGDLVVALHPVEVKQGVVAHLPGCAATGVHRLGGAAQRRRQGRPGPGALAGLAAGAPPCQVRRPASLDIERCGLAGLPD